MKPDYGAYLHTQQVSTSVALFFYEVPIDHASLTDVPCLTTMVNKEEKGTEFAISFDFTDEAAAQLLARAPYGALAALERAARVGSRGVPTIDFDPPLRVSFEARLTSLQRSSHEVFAPLLVYRVL
jgi:hypothetical protein